MAMKTLDDLFVHMLRDIYYAEKQILKNLPRMARKADAAELRDAFERHHGETETHVDTLDKVFELRNLRARGVTCEAIDGILSEAKEIMSETEQAEARDAGMIAAAQAVEHYEIARYGTLVAWARQLGYPDVAELLQTTLDQEHAADETLTRLAVTALNREAA